MKILIIAGLFFILPFFTGCGTARRGEPLSGPLELQSPELAEGYAVFIRICNQCHPGGEAGTGPALNNKHIPEFYMRFQVRHGLGVMPTFSKEKISDRQLDELVAFLKALRSRE